RIYRPLRMRERGYASIARSTASTLSHAGSRGHCHEPSGGVPLPVHGRPGDVVGVLTMADVSRDQFALIKIEGMHCHRCETSIQQALSANPGVREVEVDFPSKQASVLFDRDAVTIKQ